jgi:hypothetical protein
MSKAEPQRPLLFRWLRRRESRNSAGIVSRAAVFFLQKQQKQRKRQGTGWGIEPAEPGR